MKENTTMMFLQLNIVATIQQTIMVLSRGSQMLYLTDSLHFGGQIMETMTSNQLRFFVSKKNKLLKVLFIYIAKSKQNS